MDPEVGQRPKQDSEVPTAVAREETGYVLDEYPAGSKRLNDAGELEEEAGSVSGEAGSSSGDAEVLAGEPSAEELNTRRGVLLPLGPCSASVCSFSTNDSST